MNPRTRRLATVNAANAAADLVRLREPARVEEMARHLFEYDFTEACCERDRAQYETFDAMPSNLQEWWRGRAANRIVENARRKKQKR